jgi:anaerobic ribonucleoside-triphosphate reductase activating protein
MHLRIAQVIERTEAEGPGVRFCVWVQGCPIRCAGCCNPEMFASEGGELAVAEELAERAARAGVEGVTLLGGEPFAQPAACARFAERARASGLSVMVFTGYTLAELEAREDARDLIAACDLLVDGRFERDHLETRRRWIGSTNQRLHFFGARYSPSDPRFAARNTAEIRLTRGAITMNGWPGLVPAIGKRR